VVAGIAAGAGGGGGTHDRDRGWPVGLPFGAAAPASALEPSTQLVGKVLFGEYMLPFEIASILLLVAMIGAVVMAKKKNMKGRVQR
jgi:hypothetical protein